MGLLFLFGKSLISFIKIKLYTYKIYILTSTVGLKYNLLANCIL